MGFNHVAWLVNVNSLSYGSNINGMELMCCFYFNTVFYALNEYLTMVEQLQDAGLNWFGKLQKNN